MNEHCFQMTRNNEAPSFVGMLAFRHFRPRCTTLMSSSKPKSYGESDAPLSKLRDMQRIVGRRRARMPRPEPEDLGLGLARALFPGVADALQSKTVNGKAVSSEGNQNGVNVVEDSGASVVSHLQRDAHGSARLRGSRRTLATSASVGESQESKQGEIKDSAKMESTIQMNDADTLQTQPLEDNGSLGIDNGSGQGIEPWDTEASRTREKGQSSGHQDVGETQGTDAAAKNPQLKLIRRSGTLPWRNVLKRNENIVSEVRAEKHPPLSVFIADVVTERQDGSLPRVRYAVKSASKKNGKPRSIPSDYGAILQGLNEQQQSAVLADRSKACLVLAGPGSGKTRVLTHRIAYLVKKYNVSPSSILAVTFTNKAAQEMKERVAKLLQTKFAPDWAPDSDSRLAMGTFHSISARILREYGSEIGIAENFLICDTSDARQVMSKVMKKSEGATPASASVGEMLAMVSKLKNDRNDQWKRNLPPHVLRRVEEYREEYGKELRTMGQLDFDDLLLETRTLLQTSPSCLARLQDKYKYVLVDEWQDTNHVQFDIVALLSQQSQNLFVVGDADQSIYKFRGADSGNLERFAETYENITKVNLERNYRSSACIVAAAQCVIERNENRPDKRMTTTNNFGSKVILREMKDDRDEAHFVGSTILQLLRANEVESFAGIAAMYRTNSQSRLLEEACIKRDIPYRLLSGTKFYDRQEIRDLVAYLRILMNPSDDQALLRIINTPPRGIGKKTVEALEMFSRSHGLTLLDGFEKLLDSFQAGDSSIVNLDLKKNNLKKLVDFHRLFTLLRQKAEPCLQNEADASREAADDEFRVGSLLTAIIKEVGYREHLEKMGENEESASREKTRERLDNIDELVRAAARYTSLPRYLESVMLMVETNRKRDEHEVEEKAEAAISLMTLHGGKGLEFDAVFIVGAEDNIIPIKRAQSEGEIEEERRLLYVGMTRAKKHLCITWRGQKLMVQGDKVYRREGVGPSRFLDDISPELVDRIENASRRDGKRGSQNSTGGRSNQVQEWRVGDSVRCGGFGRGTVTIGAREGADGAWIEVMFTNGSRHYVNTVAQNVKLLYSVSS